MLKFSKSYGQVLFFMLSFFVVVNCYALTGTVTVTVFPGHKTVKTRVSGSTEVIGTNTAEYGITATCDPKPGTNEEVKAVEPSWSISSSVTFVPPVLPQNMPVPTNPGDPSVNFSGSNGTWTAKIHSPNEGQWKITFTVKVVYKLKNSITDEYIYNSNRSIKTQEFTGTNFCTLKSTKVNFQIKLIPSDAFPGHEDLTFGIGEKGTIEAWSINGQIKYKIVGSEAMPNDVISTNGTNRFRAHIKEGSASIVIKVADSNENILGLNLIVVNVIKPSGVYMVFDPNTTDNNHFFHRKGSITLEFKARYILSPSNVSFAALSIKEWGDNNIGEATYSAPRILYDPIRPNIFFDAMNGKKHEPTEEWIEIMSCKQSYEKTKNNTTYGTLINIEAGSDEIGPYSPDATLPNNIKRSGLYSLTLPIRYKIANTTPGQGGYHYENVPGKIMSKVTLEKVDNTHKITVTKGGLELSVGVDDDNKNYKSENIF
jgi:hypothetical protein